MKALVVDGLVGGGFAGEGFVGAGNKSVNEKIGTVDVKVDGLRVRTGPATYYDQAGNVLAGDTLTVYETAEGEGYTWYRIGVRQWIADKDGGWLEYHPD